VWITYAPGGGVSTTAPRSDGTTEVGTAGLRPPVFSLRVPSAADPVSVEVDLITPGGSGRDRLGAAATRQQRSSGEPYSDARAREAKLVRALMHHRPLVRLRIDKEGRPQPQPSAELRRYDACARRLLREAIEAQVAAAENEEQRRSQQQRLVGGDFARAVAPPVDHAALLLRLTRLSLPSAAQGGDPKQEREGARLSTPSSQQGWGPGAAESQGRTVLLRLNLLTDSRSPAARVCRSLPYGGLSRLRSDTCTIEGVIDGRDGWPMTLTLSRKAEFASGATETQFRSFDRVAPPQEPVPPAQVCPATS
jgi:hypothetical protein